MQLTQDQITQFHQTGNFAGNSQLLKVVQPSTQLNLGAGYIVLENYSEQAELDAMRAQANILVDDFDAEEGTVFSTKKQVGPFAT